MRSPIAYTPGSPVRQYSSTWMKPRSLTLDAGALQAELVGERAPADADDDDIDLEVLDFAAVADRRKCTVVPPAVVRRVAHDLHRRADVDAASS